MNKILSILLLLITACSLAQSPNPAIKKQFLEYSQLVIDRKIDKALEYTNPDLFKVVPKSHMKSMMEAVFNVKSIDYRTSMPSVSEFEEVKKIDEKNYVRFKSHTAIEMRFIPKPNEPVKSPDETAAARKAQFEAFENKFGKGNVTFDPATEYYTLKTIKTVIAVSDEKMADWKFAIVDNPKMKALLASFIPAELLD